MGKTRSATVSARLDEAVKAEAEKVLGSLGMNAADAIRLLFSQIARQQRLPFDTLVPNEESEEALREFREGKHLTRYESFEDFKKAMMGE